MLIKNRIDTGLVFIRIGIGIMFIVAHGGPKLLGGPERWEKVGSAMDRLGIESFHTFFGFMAAFAESFGALFLIFGLFHRWVTALLLITMLVAGARHLIDGDGIGRASHAIEAAIVFIGLFITGPGKYSFDYKLFKK
jgi:putative oxidoreductase